MLKPQDIVVALAILMQKDDSWRQSDIASIIFLSTSEVNSAIKRLIAAAILSPPSESQKAKPQVRALEEFLIHGLKYVFPVEYGGKTRGIPTSFAAPVFKKKIRFSQDDIPVWPDKDGTVFGYELLPLYGKVTKIKNQELYGFLALIDAIRSGRARERNLAIKLLQEKLHEQKSA